MQAVKIVGLSLLIFLSSKSLLLFAATAGATTPDLSNTEWRLIGRDAGQQHFSPLAQINDQNVSSLGLAWYADMPTKIGLIGVPLVADGVIYQSGPGSIVYANDAKNGKLLWRFNALIKFPGDIATGWGNHRNRGLALLDDKVFISTADCRLVAVDRKTGTRVWDEQVCSPGDGYTITAAPRVGAGKIFVAPANLDMGTRRGYVEAHDAATGKRLWRFYTVPGDPSKPFENSAMERAAKTWGKNYWKNTGGGSVWDSMTYDPKTNLLYIGTGGPAPWNPKERGQGRGDELFTNSIVALNADSGEYAWHYQVTPNDAWNFEATMPIMTADLPLKGGTRHVVMEAPKNGFFYVLDAKTGELLSAKNYAPVNWASHVDMATGRPVELPAARYYDQPNGTFTVQPSIGGAHDWRPMSYSPMTGLVYIPVNGDSTKITVTKEKSWMMGKVKFDEVLGTGSLVAWDPIQQKARWEQSLESPVNSGVLATAGNLVIQGTAAGELRAYRADKGTPLWSMSAGSPLLGTPITVEVGGRQTVFVYTGYDVTGPVRLLAYQLGGSAKLPDAAMPVAFPKPPLPRPERALVERGRELFEARGCSMCHGIEAQVYGSDPVMPDLRRASAQTHQEFAVIVLGGLRRDKGMPMFADTVSVEDLTAIQAFVLNQAWEAYSTEPLPSGAPAIIKH